MDSMRLNRFKFPRNKRELLSFVAHFGSRCALGMTKCCLEDVVLRAVRATRTDPSMARMLPVFLWRVQDQLDLEALTSKAGRDALVLGYFLDVSGRVSTSTRFRPVVRVLRRRATNSRPVFLFTKIQDHPFEAMVAQERTPPHARRWGLLTGVGLDSFANYFNKVASL